MVFMLIATSIGLAIGWIIGRWLLRGDDAGAFESQIDAERERADLAESAVADGRAELERVQLELRAEQVRFAELESTVDSQRAAIEDLEGRLAEAAAMDLEIKRLAAELDAQGGLEAELADGSAALAQAESEIERLEAELAEAAIAAERTAVGEAERAAMVADLAGYRARAADADRLEVELASGVAAREELEAEIDRLQAELTEIRAAVDEGGGLNEAALAIERRSPDHPASQIQQPPVEEQPADESLSAEALGEDRAAFERAAAPQIPVAGLSKDEGLGRMAELAARTAGAGPIADDDLKMVRGIGPKLERTLKDLGITSFRQIANFQPEDIVVVTAALNAFKGRIERDDWMSSAAQQHMEKYGEPA